MVRRWLTLIGLSRMLVTGAMGHLAVGRGKYVLCSRKWASV